MSGSPAVNRVLAQRAPAPTPERIALEEMLVAVEDYLAPTPMHRVAITKARLLLALNAARNALKVLR